MEAGSVRRLQTLRLAFDRFEASGERATQQAYATFCRAKRSWLDDWSLYAALRESNGGQAWFRWPRPIRLRQPAAMAEARRSLAREVQFQNFVQFLFDRQWNALHEHARSRGVGLIGDVPIFVAHDSADVWAQRELFMLDAEGLPKTVTGYPADEFTTDGQIWGHPHYRWAAHRRERFQWWIRRFRGILSNFDAVRIDHFLGFIKAWNIPYGAKTGRIGHWVKSPGRELFDELRRQIPKAEILAEDLGLLSPEAIRLRDHAGFPGMRLIQFGFYPNAQYHLPFKFVPDCVVYTGTHDNDTLVGWASDLRDSAGKMHVAPKQRPKRDEARATWEKICRFLSTDNVRQMPIAAMRHLMASVANTVIVPVQDLLALGSTSRMNTPGRDEDNWRWRLLAGQLKAEHAKLLSEMTTTFDRAPVEGPDARG